MQTLSMLAAILLTVLIISSLDYIITGSVVESVTLLVICCLFVPVMIYLILQRHATRVKKDDISNHDRPDVPVYKCIIGSLYEYLNPTAITSVMTENEVYNTIRNKIRVYDII